MRDLIWHVTIVCEPLICTVAHSWMEMHEKSFSPISLFSLCAGLIIYDVTD